MDDNSTENSRKEIISGTHLKSKNYKKNGLILFEFNKNAFTLSSNHRFIMYNK